MRKLYFCVSFSLLLLSGPRQLLEGQTPAAAPNKVTVHGSLRSRLEGWNWFTGEANNDYLYSGNILKVSVGQSRAGLEWQLELAAPFLIAAPNNAVAAAPQLQLGLGGNYAGANDNRHNSAMVFPKQGWVRWKNLFGDKRQSLKLGRFEFVDGAESMPQNATLAAIKRTRSAQRLIGPFGWSHVGRSFDGGHYAMQAGKTNFTIVSALPTRGAFQVDGWGNLKVAFGYASLTRQTGGGKSAGDLRVFGIYYHDWRHVLKTDSRPAATRRADMGNIRIGTFGGDYKHAWETSAGTFDALVWGAAQTGRWGRLDHRAWSLVTEAGWQPAGAAMKPWIRVGQTYGSGDDNPNDGTHGTFFQALPTPRVYAKTPFYNMMNSQDAYGMLTLRPHKSVSVVAEAHVLRLADRNDQWLLGGGAFQPWTFGFIGRPSNGERRLANLYDAGVDWNVNSALAFSMYYGYTDGRGVVKRIYPKGADGSFGYFEVNYKW